LGIGIGKQVKGLKQSAKIVIDDYSNDSILNLSEFLGFGFTDENLKNKKQRNKVKQKLKCHLDSCSVNRLIEVTSFMELYIPHELRF